MRHPSGDYTGPGAWFITISTVSGISLFGTVVNTTMVLNEVGNLVQQCWQAIPRHFPHVEEDNFVVMPNHLHGILVLRDRRSEQAEAFGRPVPGSVSTIVRSFKAASTLEARRMAGDRVVLWQRGFHDRRLWGDRALGAARRYIDDNPAEWERTHGSARTLGRSLVTCVIDASAAVRNRGEPSSW